MKPKLRVEAAKEGFAVVDDSGTVYGPVAPTRREAEETLKDWKAYYATGLEAPPQDA